MASPMNFPRIIFFDAVGTLINPEPSAPAVYADVGRRFGSRLDETVLAARFRAAFRRQEEVDRTVGLRTDEDREVARWRAIVREVLEDVSDGEACFQELYAHFARPDAWRCVPEAADVLSSGCSRSCARHRLELRPQAARPGRTLARFAADPPSRRQFGDRLAQAGRGFFRGDVPPGRFPAPEYILHVGDDPVNDYEGARAAGLRAVLLDPSTAPMCRPRSSHFFARFALIFMSSKWFAKSCVSRFRPDPCGEGVATVQSHLYTA